MSTTTLTETVVEIADHHTTLIYLKKGATSDALPFKDASQFNQLHQDIYAKSQIEFSHLRQNYQAQTLKRLSPGYDDYRYWHRLLLSNQADDYPKRAWSDMLPLTANVKSRVDILKDPAFTFRILPIPRVVLYPFGWSTWLSLRVLDPHNLDQLALLLEKLFTTKAFQLAADPTPVSLSQVMKRLSDGVRADAFGDDVREVIPPELTLVTTVLAKKHGAYSVGAPQNEAALGRILEPSGGLSHKKFIEAVYRFVQNDGDPLEYMLLKKYSSFVWMEHLLNPTELNRQKLRCYHQNTFRLQVHARHVLTLMSAAVKLKEKSVPLVELITSAIQFFDEPTFRNACFFAFLQNPEVSKIMKQARKWTGAA